MSKFKEHLREISADIASYDNEQIAVCSTNVIFYGILAAGLVSFSLLHRNETNRDRAINNTAFVFGLGSLAITRNQLLSYREHRVNINLAQE